MIASQKRVLALALVLAVLSPAGCGARKSYQVSGRAQYKDGSSITGGVRIIRFEPAGSSTAQVRKPASGEIEPDGTFTLYTRQPGDGVIPGRYLVTFTVLDKPMGGKLLIPPKYSTGADTPFDIEVDGNKSDLLYELEKQ